MQSSFKACQELPIAYRVTLHRKESCQTLNLQRLLPCLLGQFPAPSFKSFARKQHSSQAAGKGKAEGQWQTKTTVCLSPVFVKIWYAVGKVLLPMRSFTSKSGIVFISQSGIVFNFPHLISQSGIVFICSRPLIDQAVVRCEGSFSQCHGPVDHIEFL